MVFCPESQAFYVSERSLDPSVLPLAFGEKRAYIGQLESLAAAAALDTFPDILAGNFYFHFIDNQGSLGTLVRGSSSDPALASLALGLARRSLETSSAAWYEYVAVGGQHIRPTFPPAAPGRPPAYSAATSASRCGLAACPFPPWRPGTSMASRRTPESAPPPAPLSTDPRSILHPYIYTFLR